MKTITSLSLLTALALISACNSSSNAPEKPDVNSNPAKQSKTHLSPFNTKQFNHFVNAQKKQQVQQATYETADASNSSVGATASAGAPESDNITNNQHSGVDEGGIVKKLGNTLVVLRRGRLFAINTRNGTLKKSDMKNAYAEGMDPSGTWYDELLIKDNTVIVIGYSYRRGGTEIALFSLSDDGTLAHKNTYNMRSSDYYSAENYTSRLVDNKLVFYTPLQLNYFQPIDNSLPAIRQWNGNARKAKSAQPTQNDFKPTLRIPNIYNLTNTALDNDTTRNFSTLHTVTRCDLTDFELNCESKGVLGSFGRVFYVSPTSVYTWISDYKEDTEKTNGIIVRMPLNGNDPSALQVKGAPLDQLSFLEKNNTLHVLLQENGYGDGMWVKHFGNGKMSLLSVPVSEFGNATKQAKLSQYHPTPRPNNANYVTNRFIGDHLVYGQGNGWLPIKTTNTRNLYTVNINNHTKNSVSISHAADRLERLGDNVLAVGTTGNGLGLTKVSLSTTQPPQVKSSNILDGINQSESRTHGFFYKATSATQGWLGLPITAQAKTSAASQLSQNSASVLFLENKAASLNTLGKLQASNTTTQSDNCKVSCVDWYGNARPIFIGNRVFALMGYDLVEGKIINSAGEAATQPSIEEVQRLNMFTGKTKRNPQYLQE